MAVGAQDAGAPGPRPDYGPDYYGAFIIDVDGNKLEATLLPLPAAPTTRIRPRRVVASRLRMGGSLSCSSVGMT